MELEQLEVGFATGEAALDNLQVYQRVTNTLRRLLESLGLKRRAKPVGPSLGDILRKGHRRNVEEAEVIDG